MKVSFLTAALVLLPMFSSSAQNTQSPGATVASPDGRLVVSIGTDSGQPF